MVTNTDTERDAFRNVWVIAEVDDGAVQQVTFEALAAGKQIAEKRGCELWCIVLGESSTLSEESAKLFACHVDKVLLVEDPSLSAFVEETYARVAARLIGKHKPETVLCPGTLRGRSLMPRIAVLTDCGLASDCTQVEIDQDTGNLLQMRPAYGGNQFATVVTERRRPQLCTLRPRVFEAAEPDDSLSGEVVSEAFDQADLFAGKKIVEKVREEGSEVNISDAEFIISGGRGMKGPEGFELLQTLARTVDGAVGASRAAVDAGWIPYPHQVGQTGKTVQTRIYIACGISGQVQHLVGMQSSDFIVAINKDPEAPIMKIADVAVVGDLFEVVPELTKLLSKA